MVDNTQTQQPNLGCQEADALCVQYIFIGPTMIWIYYHQQELKFSSYVILECVMIRN